MELTDKERRLALVHYRWENRTGTHGDHDGDCPNRDLACDFAREAEKALGETGLTNELLGRVGIPMREPAPKGLLDEAEPTRWKPTSEQRMRARLEQIRLEEQLRAVWSRFCENCREPLGGWEIWVNLSGYDEESRVEAFYCTRCIAVNGSRRRAQD